MTFTEEYKLIKNEIINLRRHIHAHPELSFNEYNTRDSICAILDKYNISYTKGIAKTGICCVIGQKTDKVLLIRADIDALPTKEQTGLDFSSVNDGVMHACGHDIHIASALSAAIVLKKHESLLNGCVKIIFQPGEETTGGAMPMIEEGIMDNPKVTCAIAGHVTPDFENGKIKLKSGPMMASPDDFMINFIGKSAHGAEPQNGINPILPASEFTLGINDFLSDLLLGDNVLSICTLSADGSVNTIPDKALVLGTFRSFDEETRQKASEKIAEFATKCAEKYGAKADTTYNFLYPPVINEPEITNQFISIAQEVMGKENVSEFEKPLMTGDDFSYFGRYVPSVYFWFGGKVNDGDKLHSSKFVPNENSIETCAKLFYEFARRYLG